MRHSVAALPFLLRQRSKARTPANSCRQRPTTKREQLRRSLLISTYEFLTSNFLLLNSPHHPNQLQSLDQVHIAGRRSNTSPAGRHLVTIFPRPCMPARSAASALVTPTRAKNTT